MKVLGAIEYAEGKTIRERIKSVSEQMFIDEDGGSRTFTWRTISTWLYRYKKDGITSIKSKIRSDKGVPRKCTPEEVLEAINQALPHFTNRRFNRMEVYRYCVEKGLLSPRQIARTTFYRFIKEYDLLDEKEEKSKKRLAFAMQYANELWQADTMYGPYTKNSQGKPEQARLIAFIDDASRLICHGEFFFNENVDAMVSAIRNAFYKRGVPEQLYVDNGSIYTSQEITLITARVGTILRHAPVRDGAAKGKIERFFRTVRDRFLVRQLDLSSISALNRQFTQWVEDEYNSRLHSAIGMKPIDRFGIDLKRVRFLQPDKFNDELFYAETTRKVKKDNTFSFNTVRYEAPVDLRGREITIRYERSKKNRIIVYYRNNREGEAKELDLIINGKLKRERNLC